MCGYPTADNGNWTGGAWTVLTSDGTSAKHFAIYIDDCWITIKTLTSGNYRISGKVVYYDANSTITTSRQYYGGYIANMMYLDSDN